MGQEINVALVAPARSYAAQSTAFRRCQGVHLNTPFRMLVCALAAWQIGTAGACPDVTRVGIADRGYASYRTSTGYGGIVIDLFDELARRTGCRIEFVWLPSVRIMLSLSSGKIDIGAPLLEHEHRAATGRFLPYTTAQFYLIQSAPAHQRYTSLAAYVAQGHANLNTVRGLQLGRRIDTQTGALAHAGRLTTEKDFETVFRKMEMGRASATIATPVIALYYLGHGGTPDKLVFDAIDEAPPQQVGMYLSTKTLTGDTIARFAHALYDIVNDGTLGAIYLHYLGAELAARQINPENAAISAALLAAISQSTTQLGVVPPLH